MPAKALHSNTISLRNRDETLVMVTGYWLKPITIAGVTDWLKSPTGFGNQIAG
jgi:hypothetical protein